MRQHASDTGSQAELTALLEQLALRVTAGGRRSRRLLLTRKEAAAALGMSLSHFQRHVQPQLPCVYSGQLRLYRPSDLERWAEAEASSVSDGR
jgi:hypothetical protein